MGHLPKVKAIQVCVFSQNNEAATQGLPLDTNHFTHGPPTNVELIIIKPFGTHKSTLAAHPKKSEIGSPVTNH